MDKLENHRNEMIRMRDNEICEILIENNVSSQKIINVIEYFKLELEPINEVHKEYPIFKLDIIIWSKFVFFGIRNYCL